MSWAEIIGLVLKLGLIFFQERVDKDKAYARAIQSLAEGWSQNTGEFADAVARKDIDDICRSIADLRTRQLQNDLNDTDKD